MFWFLHTPCAEQGPKGLMETGEVKSSGKKNSENEKTNWGNKNHEGLGTSCQGRQTQWILRDYWLPSQKRTLVFLLSFMHISKRLGCGHFTLFTTHRCVKSLALIQEHKTTSFLKAPPNTAEKKAAPRSVKYYYKKNLAENYQIHEGILVRQDVA